MKLETMGNGQGYLKAGFLGFPKSGKTYTAALLAIGTRTYMAHDGPIAMFDTEGGSEYIAPAIKQATGKDLIGVRSHSFDDMLACGQQCEKDGVAVLIVDSVTHPWRELCEAHLAKINAGRKSRQLSPRLRLEFSDWNILKPYWAKWTDFYLNSKLHIIICGRAGYEWDFSEPDEESGKRELRKTGVKMKTEGEFGFEPSLLVEMERAQEVRDGTRILTHTATVLGDRFGAIDGKQANNPGFEFFEPHVALLKPGAHAPVDTSLKTDTGVDGNGQDAWGRERREREILAEEIQGEMMRVYPGQTAAEKKGKAELLETFFNTRSWTKVTTKTKSADLRDGLDKMRIYIIETLKPQVEGGDAA